VVAFNYSSVLSPIQSYKKWTRSDIWDIEKEVAKCT
jgi:hypothetical protein